MSKLCFILIFATVTTAEFWGSTCRSGWEQHGNSCYLLKRTNENWNEAMHQCEVFKAFLAEINTAEENTFIQQALKNHHRTRYWIGGMDTEVDGIWRWASSDTKVTFFDWSPGQPDNAGSNEDCLEIAENLHWNDRPCHTAQGFICEHILEQ